MENFVPESQVTQRINAAINNAIEAYKERVVEVARGFMESGELCDTEAGNIWDKLDLPGSPHLKYDATFTVRIDIRGIVLDGSNGDNDDIEDEIRNALNELNLTDNPGSVVDDVDSLEVEIINAVVLPADE